NVTKKVTMAPVEVAGKSVPLDEPTVGLADSLGDALSVLRGGIFAVQKAIEIPMDGIEVALTQIANATDLAKEVGDAIFALKAAGEERNFDLIQNLQDLNFNSSNESASRMDVFKAVQALRELSDQYRAKLAEGNRLIDQRTAFNKRVAAQAQANRY